MIPNVSSGSGLYLEPYQDATPSCMTRHHLVSEPFPYPRITGLGTWLRIADFKSFYTLSFNRIFTIPLGLSPKPLNTFVMSLVSTDFTGFPNNLMTLLSLLKKRTRGLYLRIGLQCFPQMVFLFTIWAPPCWRQDKFYLHQNLHYMV